MCLSVSRVNAKSASASWASLALWLMPSMYLLTRAAVMSQLRSLTASKLTRGMGTSQSCTSAGLAARVSSTKRKSQAEDKTSPEYC